jgi:branched-chain amino acid transport system substrate-binding protein
MPIAVALALPASAEQVVRIGSASPVSGPSAHLGKDTENGARMAVDDLNAKGFSIDGKPVRLQLLAEDDGGDPKQGTAVAQKLVDAGVVGVVGHLNSGTTVPASKIYHTAGVAQITPSATTPAYTRQGFKSAFRLVANDSRVGSTLGRQAVLRLKARRIAVIDDRTAFGQGLADEFIKGVKAADGKVEIVSRQFTTDKATDFNAILTQVRSKKPDLVFYGGMDAVASARKSCLSWPVPAWARTRSCARSPAASAATASKPSPTSRRATARPSTWNCKPTRPTPTMP